LTGAHACTTLAERHWSMPFPSTHVGNAWGLTLATPMSPSFTFRPSSRNTFKVLMSRWSIFRECMWLRPRRICKEADSCKGRRSRTINQCRMPSTYLCEKLPDHVFGQAVLLFLDVIVQIAVPGIFSDDVKLALHEIYIQLW